jgi:AcrR family transcriptional regulator
MKKRIPAEVGRTSEGDVRRSRVEKSTPDLLVAAAAKEFQEHGYGGTDTNKIARRAGFAPQTFYRWFQDKTEIFVAVYRAWAGDQSRRLDLLWSRNASDGELIDAVIANHRAYHIFRRSLRQLTVEDDAVRKARAASRLEQIESIKARYKPVRRSNAEIAIFIFEHERLCDALADGEVSDLGVDESAVRAHLQELYRRLRRR